MYTQLVDIL